MSSRFSQKVTAPAGILVQETEGCSILLDVDTETMFDLDEVGTAMWQALTTSETIKDAFEHLLERFEVDADRLREDLEDLVKRLTDAGLLVRE